VHISGVEDASLPFEQIRDAHRVLVGPDDRCTALPQIRALSNVYAGAYSFEPFAASVHGLEDVTEALERSMGWIDHELARPPA
jgi:2-keto-myo-inositol isomerase